VTALCVFCSSSREIEASHLDLAAGVGRGIGERGWSLVSGGGAISMMGEVARAARGSGATTVGVIPTALMDVEITDHDADELIVTDDMRTRKAVMDARADAFLAMAGGIGTLEELLEVWVARTLGMHDKPVVVLDPDGVFASLREQIETLVEQSFLRRSAADALVWTTSVDDAFAAVEAGLTSRALLSPTQAELLEDMP
jgi:uncharacterized protein (TIGR00730 family)